MWEFIKKIIKGKKTIVSNEQTAFTKEKPFPYTEAKNDEEVAVQKNQWTTSPPA